MVRTIEWLNEFYDLTKKLYCTVTKCIARPTPIWLAGKPHLFCLLHKAFILQSSSYENWEKKSTVTIHQYFSEICKTLG